MNDDLIERLRQLAGNTGKMTWVGDIPMTATAALHLSADLIETQAREIERLREAVGILEDGLQEVGDDYPGSSCQEWCQHQIKQARAALAGDSHATGK